MTAKEWLQKAREEKFAIGAFNVGNLETFKAVVLAAASKKSPIIVESSPGETSWMGADNIIDLARNFSQDFSIPIFVNLDHAGSWEECLQGIEAGYNLIHFDGSGLSYEENVNIAKKVAEMTHLKGLVMEGEMDQISGSSEIHRGVAQAEVLTDPEKAKEFVQITGVDIFAVSVGNVHGIFSGGGENLQLDILDQIRKVLPNTYFSLHGGSGIAGEQIKEVIERGVVKININTELREAFKENLKGVLQKNPQELAMYKIEGPVLEAVQKIVEEKIEIFGSAGKI